MESRSHRAEGKRENNSHIDCGCPREKKIPVLELEFIKAQRTKAEGQGSMQMGSIDCSETKKQIANAKKREQIREREQKKKMKSEEAIQREEELCQDVYHFFDSSSDEQEATSDDKLATVGLIQELDSPKVEVGLPSEVPLEGVIKDLSIYSSGAYCMLQRQDCEKCLSRCLRDWTVSLCRC
ncbi:hypothetical protein Hamer_G028350 [Homarus americanus]|uniref:Uncharacterized protein n=1 Tax=Homarus americanus TaxID=6706 RepID=A0A8J5JHJ1_HOMAM|nr:hypothetical protein Hamer_G028350 [Homarus americanus]